MVIGMGASHKLYEEYKAEKFRVLSVGDQLYQERLAWSC